MTGSKVLRILRKHGLAPEIPEDLYHLIKKAVSMRKHLEQFRKDRDGKFRLILVESRIHRLARYYKVGMTLVTITNSARFCKFANFRSFWLNTAQETSELMVSSDLDTLS